MRIEYQYQVNLNDFYEVKPGQVRSFNGFCKTIDDCIAEGKMITEKYPLVDNIYFQKVIVFPKLGIIIHFCKKSLAFDAFDDGYKTLTTCDGKYKLLWDDRMQEKVK